MWAPLGTSDVITPHGPDLSIADEHYVQGISRLGIPPEQTLTCQTFQFSSDLDIYCNAGSRTVTNPCSEEIAEEMELPNPSPHFRKLT